jgi:hypothetical protein
VPLNILVRIGGNGVLWQPQRATVIISFKEMITVAKSTSRLILDDPSLDV